jgi:hypothetical protein
MSAEITRATVIEPVEASAPSSRVGLAPLEIEIADLREMNVRLERRLREVEMNAELRITAARLLALPLPEDG